MTRGGVIQRRAKLHQHRAFGDGAEDWGEGRGLHGLQEGGDGDARRAETAADLAVLEPLGSMAMRPEILFFFRLLSSVVQKNRLVT